MVSIEQTVKDQYARFFTQNDWHAFKRIADYYLETAAHLKTKDVHISDPFKLLVRNIQKRLFLGIGTELLIKAFYLKNGYGINKPNKGKDKLYKINSVTLNDYNVCNTYTINFLIQEMEEGRVPEFANNEHILKGFKIAKVFRNKEGHIAVYSHKFDSDNYSDIEQALILFYKLYFNQALAFQVSMEPNEKSTFAIKQLN